MSGSPVEPPDRGRRRLRWAMRAYPSEVRRAEGDVLVALARDLVDAGESSIDREALGLLRGGLAMRFRAVAVADWDEALRRAATGIAGVLLAIVCGAAATWQREPAWPGWSGIVVVAAPALVLAGHLAGRRFPVACGALLLIVLGVAQGNSHLPTVPLEGSVEWGVRGGGWQAGSAGAVHLPLLSCALPATLILLASAAHTRRRVPRSAALATVAWVIAGALAVRLVLESTVAMHGIAPLVLGDIRLDGIGSCMIAAGAMAVAALAVGAVRRRRDPAALLAGALVVAAILPIVCLYASASLPIGDGQRLAFAVSMIGTLFGLLKVVRLSATVPS